MYFNGGLWSHTHTEKCDNGKSKKHVEITLLQQDDLSTCLHDAFYVFNLSIYTERTCYNQQTFSHTLYTLQYTCVCVHLNCRTVYFVDFL